MCLFLFIFFPVLNLGTVRTERSFFLWFACNQAVHVGGQGQNFQHSRLCAGSGRHCRIPGAYDTAQEHTGRSKSEAMFPGSQLDNQRHQSGSGHPAFSDSKLRCRRCSKVCRTDAASDWVISQTSINTYHPFGSLLTGQCDPLIPVPWFNIQGLTSPMFLTVSARRLSLKTHLACSSSPRAYSPKPPASRSALQIKDTGVVSVMNERKIRNQKGAAVTGLVLALFFFIMLVGFFSFDSSRIQMAQRELTATCDSASLAGTAMLTSYPTDNDDCQPHQSYNMRSRSSLRSMPATCFKPVIYSVRVFGQRQRR